MCGHLRNESASRPFNTTRTPPQFVAVVIGLLWCKIKWWVLRWPPRLFKLEAAKATDEWIGKTVAGLYMTDDVSDDQRKWMVDFTHFIAQQAILDYSHKQKEMFWIKGTAIPGTLEQRSLPKPLPLETFTADTASGERRKDREGQAGGARLEVSQTTVYALVAAGKL